jgi:MATE family multidrug resistance protein
MRNLMIASFAIYLATWWLLQPFGNSGLWGALRCSSWHAASLQAWRYPALARSTFADMAPQLTPARAPR